MELIWVVSSPWCLHGRGTETSFNLRGRIQKSIAFVWCVAVSGLQSGVFMNVPRQLIDVASGLEYLHYAGVIHGNLRGVRHPPQLLRMRLTS